MGGIRRVTDINNIQPHNITDELWEYEGIKGDSEQPKEVGMFKGQYCIIAAGAEGVYQELEQAKTLMREAEKEFTLLCVNDIVMYLHNVYAVVTAHPDRAHNWIKLRMVDSNVSDQGFGFGNTVPLIFSDTIGTEGVDVLWSGLGNQVGTSGMLACLIAICMGFEKILLCGMPIDFSLPHFYSPFILPQSEEALAIHKASWEYATNKLPTFKDKVRSYNGKTKNLLGEPTIEWLSK